MAKWILISVRPIQHHWREVRVQGISPVHGKWKFIGAKDTETLFMHKSISILSFGDGSYLQILLKCLPLVTQTVTFGTVYTFHISYADSLLPSFSACQAHLLQQRWSTLDALIGVKCRPGSPVFFKQIPFPPTGVDWSGGTASAVPNAATEAKNKIKNSKAPFQTLPFFVAFTWHFLFIKKNVKKIFILLKQWVVKEASDP